MPSGTTHSQVEPRPSSLVTAHDRIVLGRAVIIMGCLNAVAGALTWGVPVDGTAWGGIARSILQLGYCAVVLAVIVWRERQVCAWPRHTRRTAILGVGLSGLPYLVGALAVWVLDVAPLEPMLAVTLGVVSAAPAIIAGRLISSGAAARRDAPRR